MKKAKLASLIAVALCVLAGLVPAHAAASGNGGVTGTVTSSPGIVPPPGHPDSFHFTPIVLTGNFDNGNGHTFQGEITTSDVYGRTIGSEDTTQGNGVVDPFTFHDTLTIDGSRVNGTCGGTTPGSAGTFQRVLTAVTVTLHCKLSIDATTAVPTTVTVVAQFTPTAGDGVTTPVTAANFSGEYVFN